MASVTVERFAMTGPVQSRVATGASGNPFTFTNQPASPASPTNPENWSKLPRDNVYRQEWDAFARDLGVNGQNAQARPLILDAINRYHSKVMSAQARGVESSASARMEAVREVRQTIFAPETSASLARITAPQGALTGLVKSGLGTLASDPSLAQSSWGASLQTSLTGVKTQLSFYRGVAEGVVSGGQDIIVGLATVAGKVAQFSTDATIGLVGDAIRNVLPSGAQAWMRESAAIPSYERAVATTQKAVDTLGAVKDYIATRTPEQVGADIKGFVEKNWESLKASHAEAAAKGPEAEARWWGQVTGRAAFEVASVVVPVTKVATALKAAEKVEDVGDVARVAAKTETILERARRILGDLPLNSASLDTLYSAGKLTMDEARVLAKSVEWKDSNGRWIYPPNDGFSGVPKMIKMMAGDQILIDRYGKSSGTFASPLGESFSGRALPPGTQKTAEYHVYKVTGDVDALVGRATPWFDEPGGGIQYKLDTKIDMLLSQGKLVELKR